RLSRGREAAVWGTALALVTEATYRESGDATADENASLALLLGVKGRVLTDDPEVADMCDIDMGLAGWPWATDNFSWVEPTAWACVAVHRLGGGGPRPVGGGERLPPAGGSDEGGSNCGTRRPPARMPDPTPAPPALLLIPLKNRRDEPRVRAAVIYLAGQL